MPNSSTTDLAWQPCEKFGQYIGLLLEFAGDRSLLDEIIRHRLNCEKCETNYRNYEDWRKKRDGVEKSERDRGTGNVQVVSVL